MAAKSSEHMAILLGGGAAVAYLLYKNQSLVSSLLVATPTPAPVVTPTPTPTDTTGNGYVYDPTTGLYSFTDVNGAVTTYNPDTGSTYTSGTPGNIAVNSAGQTTIQTAYGPVTTSDFTDIPNPVTGAETGTPAAIQPATNVGTPTITQLLQTSVPDAVTAEYVKYFNRQPDAAGLAYWVGVANSQLAGGASWALVASNLQTAFATSVEAQTVTPTPTPPLIQSPMPTPTPTPTPAPTPTPTPTPVSTTPTLAQVQTIVDSIFTGTLATRGQWALSLVVQYYNQYLHRAPDTSGLTYWLQHIANELAAGVTQQDIMSDMVANFSKPGLQGFMRRGR